MNYGEKVARHIVELYSSTNLSNQWVETVIQLFSQVTFFLLLLPVLYSANQDTCAMPIHVIYKSISLLITRAN